MRILLSTGSVHHLDPEIRFWVADRLAHYQMPAFSVHAPLEVIEGWGDYWGHLRETLTWTRHLNSDYFGSPRCPCLAI